MPYLGRSSNFGVRSVFHYLPSAGDTSVSGADANGKTLSFADGNYVDVYLNGVKLKTGTDYNTTTANTIAGLTALASNDEVTVVVYDAFSLATGFETLGGTFGGAVTISDTTASSSATTGALIVSGGVGVAADLSVGDDLRLISDSSVLSFGTDSDVTVTHDPDDGLILKSTATGDDNPFLLTLQTGETDIAANDVLGAINFQAPDEGTGTDAILVAAGIEAVSEGDFSSSSNATKLSFKTASSATASETMSLSSGGNLEVSGAITANSASTINVTGGSALTLKSTDAGSTAAPVLAIQRDSGSPADSDLLGKIIFSGDDDAGNSVDFATINIKALDVSDGSEDAEFDISTVVGGTSRSRMRADSTETIFNENGQNLDFRVEGVAEANVLVVDAANDNVLIGCNALPSDSVGGAGFENAADDRMILNLSTTTTSSRNVVVFRNPNNAVGTINTSGTTTGFNTSSDYRLKENVVTDWDATSRLKKLKPSQFNFKADKDTTVDGFLAHEVSSVVPIAITGEKDAVDKDGNPEYQGIDQSKLVPLLTKALQESIARADALEARIKKLEDG